MIRRAFLVAAAAVALTLTPSVAMAYDAPGFDSSVSDSTPSIGAPVTVSIDGGAENAGKVIRLEITSASGTKTMSATADSNGVATFTLTPTAAGTNKVEAFNAAGELLSDQVLTVGSAAAAPLNNGTGNSAGNGSGSSTGNGSGSSTGNGSGSGASLASTGFDGMPLAIGGGFLVLAGAGAVVVAKRRRSTQVPA
jgi:LPXTG-motif cell wall-anchored protein